MSIGVRTLSIAIRALEVARSNSIVDVQTEQQAAQERRPPLNHTILELETRQGSSVELEFSISILEAWLQRAQNTLGSIRFGAAMQQSTTLPGARRISTKQAYRANI